MNNQLLNAEELSPAQTDLQKLEKALAEGTAILEAVQGLKSSNHYRVFRRIVLDPAIRVTEKRVENNMRNLAADKDGTILKSILQDQGMLVAFKKFAELDSLEEMYKVEVKGLNDRIKKHA